MDQRHAVGGVLILVFAFRSSAALGYAYGMAVTGTITITTLLFLYVARTRMALADLGGGARRRRAAHRRLDVPGRQPDQTSARRVASVAHRHRRLHRRDHLAAWT